MKRSILVQGVGAFLIIVGLIVTGAALSAGGDVESFTIPAGEGWFYVFEYTSVPTGSVFQGRFVETAGHPVNVFVFNSEQYVVYEEQGVPSEGAVFWQHASEGRFSATVSSPGAYYIVVAHGVGYDDVAQGVRVYWRDVAVDPSWWPAGVVVIVVGIGLVVAGHRREKREQVLAPPLPLAAQAQTRVTYYPQEPPQPPPPSPPGP